MGNQKIKGLPTVFEKNWCSVPNNHDLFRSNLTGEYVRRNFVRIQSPNQIQEFKQRMKQTNPYVCRVVFFHHYENDIYAVYTDDTKNKLQVKHHDEWKILKKKILDVFLSLSRKYGPMRVFPQMIGADSKNQIKIWIHPNPIQNFPEQPCTTQIQMIEDILIICKDMQEKTLEQFKNKIQTNKFLLPTQQNPYIYQTNKHIKLNFNNQIKLYSSPSERVQRPKLTNKYYDKAKKKPKHTCPIFLVNKTKQQKQQTQNILPISYSLFINDESFDWQRSKTQNFHQVNQTLQERLRKNSQQIYNNHSQIRVTYIQPKIKQYTIVVKKQLLQTSQSNSRIVNNPQFQQQELSLSPKRFQRKRNQHSLDIFEKQSKQNRNLSNRKKQRAPKFLNSRRSPSDKEESPIKKQTRKRLNMTKKLRNVAYMPVREERQSELTYTGDLKQIKQKNINQNSSTVDSDLLKFFDEREKKQYFEVQQKIKKNKEKYGEFHKFVHELLDK